MKASRTGYCSHLPAEIKIDGNGTSSSLTLLTIHTQNCMGIFEKEEKANEKASLLKAFENEFIE